MNMRENISFILSKEIGIRVWFFDFESKTSRAQVIAYFLEDECVITKKCND